MLLKRYEATEVDRRTWLHMCPRGLTGPPAMTHTNKNLYNDIRKGQAMLRPSGFKLRSDGWRSPD